MADDHPDLRDHAHNESFLLDIVGFYRVCILKDLACYSGSVTGAVDVSELIRTEIGTVPE